MTPSKDVSRNVTADPVAALAEVLGMGPLWWEVKRPDGAFVMTKMTTPEGAAEHIITLLKEAGWHLTDKDAAAQVAVLREALVQYGNHAAGCEYGPALPCTCGWRSTTERLFGDVQWAKAHVRTTGKLSAALQGASEEEPEPR